MFRSRKTRDGAGGGAAAATVLRPVITANVSVDDEDDYFSAILAGVPDTVDIEEPHEAEASSSPSKEDFSTAAGTSVAAGPIPDVVALTASDAGPSGVVDDNAKPAAASVDDAMAELEAAKAARRRTRARTSLPATEIEAKRQIYLRVQKDMDAALLAERVR